MRIAYADPPYMGQAQHHYANDPSGIDAQEVDHKELIDRMTREYDGWALSLSTPTMNIILPMCPQNVRVGAWVKPFASFKPNVNPAYAWEPVIFWGGRKRTREQPTLRDWVSSNITMRRGTHGAKPDSFCLWVFEFLGMVPEDEFADLFPGSGAVGRAWNKYRGMMGLDRTVSEKAKTPSFENL